MYTAFAYKLEPNHCKRGELASKGNSWNVVLEVLKSFLKSLINHRIKDTYPMLHKRETV